jgi:hypothetical protein
MRTERRDRGKREEILINIVIFNAAVKAGSAQDGSLIGLFPDQ